MRALLLTTLTVCALLVVGCGDDDDGGTAGSADTTSPPTTAGATEVELPEGAVDLRGEARVEIEVTDNLFTPDTVVVDPGTEVVWVNAGRNPHNVIPDTDGAFEAVPTEELEPGTEATRVFDATGTFAYHCSIHGAPGVGQFATLVVA